MMAEEKQQLLVLLDRETSWCRHVEARDARGAPVHCDAETATAWDVTGAMFRLFGWNRAATLYVQLDRHIHGKRRTLGWPRRSPELDAMVALQEFNDRPDTTFDIVRSQLESAPVWSGEKRSYEPAPNEPTCVDLLGRACEWRPDANERPTVGSETGTRTKEA
jgi:hypothetical protein